MGQVVSHPQVTLCRSCLNREKFLVDLNFCDNFDLESITRKGNFIVLRCEGYHRQPQEAVPPATTPVLQSA